MKLTSIYRHYWPDTAPYAQVLRAILEDRAARGDEVEVLTAQPSYNDNRQPERPLTEVVGGVKVRRFRLPSERKSQLARRAATLGWFLGRAAVSLATTAPSDVLLINGHPPVGMGLLARAVSTRPGTQFVYHCQDIHPEALLLGGHLQNGRLFRALQVLDTHTCNRATAVVVLSDDMRRLMVRRGVASEKLVVINNFPEVVTPDVDVSATLASVRPGSFIVLFAGNLGDFQGLDLLAAAAVHLQAQPDIQFVFMGSGLAESRLKSATESLRGRTVHFLGQRSVEVARAVMARASLGVVSLLPGVHQVAYPSKLMAYVAAPCPVLGLVESASSIAQDIRNLELGHVCSERTPEDIAIAIEGAFAVRTRWSADAREALRKRGELHFGREQALQKWGSLFARIAPSTTTEPA